MSAELIHVLGLASAGITVAAAGAALIIVRLVFSDRLSREIDDELRIGRR
jgi:hypothetical protein